MNQPKRILRLDASANPGPSGSQAIGNQLLERVRTLYPDVEVRQRDLNSGAEFIDSRWIAANFSAADDRDEQELEDHGSSSYPMAVQ